MRFKLITILALLSILLVGCGQTVVTSTTSTATAVTTSSIATAVTTPTTKFNLSELTISDDLLAIVSATPTSTTTSTPTATSIPPFTFPTTIITSTITYIPPVMNTDSSDLFIDIISVTSPVTHGHVATLKAKTTPNTICGIKVYYSSGLGDAAGLYSQRSDDAGMVQWTWKVGTNTTPGKFKITVTAYDVGSSLTAVTDQVYFEVK